MRILHLSTSDITGGAARAAYRLHTGLGRLGHQSQMLVLKRTSTDATVSPVKWFNDLPTRFRRSRRIKNIAADFARYRPTLPPGYELFSDDRSPTAFDLPRQLPPCDIINLHWVAGLIDHPTFFSALPPNVPLVWRLADMNPLTGGCHYDGSCGKFTSNCGSCPVLGSDVEDDLSRQVWQRKNAALASLPISRLHLVGTSRWIMDQAKSSSLLGRFPATVIPNGLDTEDFAPRDKNFSRDTLGVPRSVRVILFVADSAAITRKGFDQLAAALRFLAEESNLFLLSVGGGKPNVPGLPQLHLGKITNDRMLSIVYSSADVFVIPSLQESFGQTITESLACGTPVAGFNTGGIPDMVRPGITGELATVADPRALAEAIKKILASPPSAGQCRQIAAEEYSLQTQARSYERLYQSLLQPPGVA